MKKTRILVVTAIACVIASTMFVKAFAAKPPPEEEGANQRLNFELPADGTLGDLIELFAKKYPDYAINISSPELKAVKIGEIKYHGIWAELPDTLEQAGRGRFSSTLTNNTLFIHKSQYGAESSSTPKPDDLPAIDMDLPADSTIGDAIAVLKKKYPQYGLYVTSEAAYAVKVGSLKLQGASISKLALALSAATRGRAYVQDFGRNLYIHDFTPPKNSVSAFNIGPWLGDAGDDAAARKVRQLDEMIKQVVDAANTGNAERLVSAPASSYLPTGKIYIVVGTADGVRLATKVMESLVPKVIPAETPPNHGTSEE